MNFRSRFDAKEQIINELEELKPLYAWTEGNWDFGSEIKKWNAIQNIQRDIELVTNHIILNYNH